MTAVAGGIVGTAAALVLQPIIGAHGLAAFALGAVCAFAGVIVGLRLER